MHGLKAVIVGLCAIGCSIILQAAPASSQTVDVRNLITVTQFHETGLDTLSTQQLAALNVWLGQYLGSHSTATSAPVDVRNIITVTQFDQTGFDKLSPVQIDAFDGWLSQYLNTHPAVPSASVVIPQPSQPATTSAIASFGADSMAPKKSPATPDRIETRIAGMFTGWDGDTVFKLENGQVWQQAGTGYFTNVKLDSPQVVIKKLFHGYLLTLPDQGETVFVRRVK